MLNTKTFLYNTLTKKVEEFVPNEEGKVTEDEIKAIIREGRKYFELLFRLDKRANYGMCESGIPKKRLSGNAA